MPCPTQRPSAQQFRSPSDGSLHASKLWVAERSVEEAAPALIALPALQQGSRPSLQLCAGKTLPAQSSTASTEQRGQPSRKHGGAILWHPTLLTPGPSDAHGLFPSMGKEQQRADPKEGTMVSNSSSLRHLNISQGLSTAPPCLLLQGPGSYLVHVARHGNEPVAPTVPAAIPSMEGSWAASGAGDWEICFLFCLL